MPAFTLQKLTFAPWQRFDEGTRRESDFGRAPDDCSYGLLGSDEASPVSMRQIPEPDPELSPAADLALVRGVLARDPQAAQRFLERIRCVARMLAARNRKLGSPLEASELEDVAQETIIALWSRLDSFDGRTSLEGWCWGFCRVALWTNLRTKRRRDESLLRAGAVLRTSDEHEPSESMADEHDLVRRGIAQLPESESEVVELKHIEDLTFDDIGRRLSISTNTAKTRYYRALTKLRAFLARKPSGRGATV